MTMTAEKPKLTAEYLYNIVRSLERKASALQDVMKFIGIADNLHDVLEKILLKVMDLTSADGGVIALADPRTGHFDFTAAGWSGLLPADAIRREKILRESHVALTDGVVGLVFRTGEAINLDDLGKSPEFRRNVAEKTGYLIRNLLAVPLRIDDVRLGVLELVNKKPAGAFTAEDAHLAIALAHPVALVIESHRFRGGRDRGSEKISAELEEAGNKVKHLTQELDFAHRAQEQTSNQIHHFQKLANEAVAVRDKSLLEAQRLTGNLQAAQIQVDAMASQLKQMTSDLTQTRQKWKDSEEEGKTLAAKLKEAYRAQEQMNKEIEELKEERKAQRVEREETVDRFGRLLRRLQSFRFESSFEGLLKKFTEDLLDLSGGEIVRVFIDDNARGPRLAAAAGYDAKDIGHTFLRKGTGLAGWTWENGETAFAADTARDERFSKDIDEVSGRPSKTVLSVPLPGDGRSYGVAQIINKKGGGGFSEPEIQILSIYALGGALALKRSVVAQESNSILFSVLQAVIDAIETRGGTLKGRARRLHEITEALAQALGVKGGQLKIVEMAALVQEAGKLAVPEKIFHKQGELSESEKRLLLQVPLLGEEILASIPALKDAAPMARHANERWDGQGFPDRLKGKEIPLGARVIAVAKTFEALTSDRPYRKRLPGDVALKEIISLAGSQLDPACVEALADLYQKGGIQDE